VEPPKPQRLAVLVAEDNAVMQTVIKFMLSSWGYEPILTVNGTEAWDILRGENAPRLALLDWMMPGVEGVELCRRVRAAAKEPYTYLMLLSGRTDSSDLIRAMDAGADDYLRKPFDAEELRVRLNAGRRIIQLQEQLVAAREELRDQAMRDSLTGLLNHAHILQALQDALRRDEPVAVLLADLDRFRQINDSFGHPAGDEVLREFCRRFRTALPADAALGRYGGQEFLAVLPRCDSLAAREWAERLREAIGGDTFTAGAAAFPVTCSVGIAYCENPYTSDAATLLRQVDEALFWAKREGRKASGAASAPAAAPPPAPSYRETKMPTPA
jgi:two-component system, cell cycle response regulator